MNTLSTQRLNHFFRQRPSTILGSRENLFVISTFLIVRMAVLVVLFWITAGHEVAIDPYHRMLIDDPLGILSGRAGIDIASYPPLQFLIEWPLYHFFDWFAHDFLAIRLTLLCVELAALLVTLHILSQLSMKPAIDRVIKWGIAVGPHQLLAVAVFVQDEVIAQLFMLTTYLLIISRQKTLAMVCLGAGVLIGNVFLIIPMFYLTVFYRRSLNDFWGWALVVGVYVLNAALVFANDGHLPFSRFTSIADYGSSFWVIILAMFPNDISELKDYSLQVSVYLQMALIALYLKKSRLLVINLSATPILIIPLLCFFLTFYQHMPEFLLLVCPLVFLLCSGLKSSAITLFLLSLSWLVDLLYRLKNIGVWDTSVLSTRNQILEAFTERLSIEFDLLHTFVIIIYSTLYIACLLFIWRGSKRGTLPQKVRKRS